KYYGVHTERVRAESASQLCTTDFRRKEGRRCSRFAQAGAADPYGRISISCPCSRARSQNRPRRRPRRLTVKERTSLGERILRHWRENRPQMVSDLENNNRLDQAVLEAQELTGDLLYELVSVQKMDHHAAWELATKDWAFLPSEARPRRGSTG